MIETDLKSLQIMMLQDLINQDPIYDSKEYFVWEENKFQFGSKTELELISNVNIVEGGDMDTNNIFFSTDYNTSLR